MRICICCRIYVYIYVAENNTALIETKNFNKRHTDIHTHAVECVCIDMNISKKNNTTLIDNKPFIKVHTGIHTHAVECVCIDMYI